MFRPPGHDAAAAVHRGVGHVQAVHLPQLGSGTLAGFGDALWHAVEVLQGGLAGKQRGCIGDGAERSVRAADRHKQRWDEKQGGGGMFVKLLTHPGHLGDPRRGEHLLPQEVGKKWLEVEVENIFYLGGSMFT